MAFYISRFKNMERREFEVEIVTPLFMGGSDPRDAELRAPSIKGALRFWWRAFHPELSIAQLRSEESQIFGDPGELFGKSRIRIRLVKDLAFENKKDRPVPHKSFVSPCFAPGKIFSLAIYGDKMIFGLFELFTIVGGLGKRSRRGFGSIRIDKVDTKAFCGDLSTNHIMSLVESIAGDNFNIDNKEIVRAGAIHSQAQYAYVKKIEIGDKEYESADSILRQIGQSSHENNSDYTGYAGRGQERFSSPVYVSVVKAAKGYKPVVTSLNTAFKPNHQNHGVDRSADFKKTILSGGFR